MISLVTSIEQGQVVGEGKVRVRVGDREEEGLE